LNALTEAILKSNWSRFVLSSAPLLLLAIWAITLGIRVMTVYSDARKQSRQFAPEVAGALREGKFDKAIELAQLYKKSHIAQVISAGVQEFRVHENEADLSIGGDDSVSGTLKRAESIVHGELEEGVPQLSLISVIAPAVGLVVTLLLVIDTLRKFSGRFMDVNGLAGAIGPTLMPLAAGLIVAVLACCLFFTFTKQLRAFDVEMKNASSELMSYFVERRAHETVRK
jgi:biopolymer transport protein ExbB